MTKYPGDEFFNANKSKTWNKQTYYWCKKHDKFTCHQTKDCRLPAAAASESNTTSPLSATNVSNAPRLQVSAVVLTDE